LDITAITLYIVDDHPLFRRGVRYYLDTVPGIVVSGEAESGEKALASLAAHPVDVVLLDVHMPGLDGVETLTRLMANAPHTRVLMLTSFGGWERVQAALEAGAAGYVLKDAGPEELTAAIRAVAAGGSYLDARATAALLQRTRAPDPGQSPDIQGTETLSEREREVLAHVCRGLGNREIAEALVVSEKTVKTHVANILGKLGAKNRTQAALIAMRRQLVPDP